MLAYIINPINDHLDDAVDVQVLAVEVVLISPPDAIIAGIEFILDFGLVHKFDLCFFIQNTSIGSNLLTSVRYSFYLLDRSRMDMMLEKALTPRSVLPAR